MYRELTKSVVRTTFSGNCVFSIKLMKSVVSLMQVFSFIAIGRRSESIKLEIRSVGPLLQETIGLLTHVFRLGLVTGLVQGGLEFLIEPVVWFWSVLQAIGTWSNHVTCSLRT